VRTADLQLIADLQDRPDPAWRRRRVRHAGPAGFDFDDVAVRVTAIAASSGRGGKSVTVGRALFEGVLIVRDVDRFVRAIESGIGPAKAYGFGLLSIARLP
jgi:CRISPR-associated protein Cas6/Cse3/CasE subtype I-E